MNQKSLTHDGQEVTIHTNQKAGMSIFVMFGYIGDKPCHWTKEGKYRMDGKDHPLDLKGI